MVKRALSQARLPDSDKVTVNVGLVDLAQVDLLVDEGFYSNRTDLVRAAIRNLLQQHADVIRQAVVRKRYVMGLHRYSLRELEQVVAQGEQLEINVLGLAVIEDDVPVELAVQAIASIHVLGAFVAAPAVRQALADRIYTRYGN
ncbi:MULTISPECIES: CopG family transcriptional regulator [Massilia]|uniref:CopG family transcriptional regulator n=2 Tax=Massilia TaxID=149698 RepID=A0A422QKA3_9BURK|nr:MULTISPECIES: CopG family transcriptional regulator [Massilia]MDY0963536.1 CopG family transcriptional regulator [Massilia sp. CFBP9026]RNF30398.1 CopG family transcriptional regulator [Massilia aurea]TXF96883.1 CopG family transcriptional regulator [Massilia arenae]